MFRVTHRLSSGAQKLYLQPLVLHTSVVAGRRQPTADYLPQQKLKLDESGLKFKHKMVAKWNRTRSFASWKHEVESSAIEDLFFFHESPISPLPRTLSFNHNDKFQPRHQQRCSKRYFLFCIMLHMVLFPLTSASHNVLTSSFTVFNFTGFFRKFILAKGLPCINILVMFYRQQKKFWNVIISVQSLDKKIHA